MSSREAKLACAGTNRWPNRLSLAEAISIASGSKSNPNSLPVGADRTKMASA
jgi:hypothetical protein